MPQGPLLEGAPELEGMEDVKFLEPVITSGISICQIVAAALGYIW